MKKYILQILKTMSLWVFFVIWSILTVYAISTLPRANNWDILSMEKWNAVIDKVNELIYISENKLWKEWWTIEWDLLIKWNLISSNSIIKTQFYTDENEYNTSSTSWISWPSFIFNKSLENSNLFFNGSFPFYVANWSSGYGLRLQYSFDNLNWVNAWLIDGPAHWWWAWWYWGNTSWITNFMEHISWINISWDIYFRIQYKVWSSSDTLWLIKHTSYSKRATWLMQEISK